MQGILSKITSHWLLQVHKVNRRKLPSNKNETKTLKSINEKWHVLGTNDLFIIMGIPATIEFLSSLRSNLQLLVIKNIIKTTAKNPKGIKLKFTQSIYTRTLKQEYKEISIQK